MKPTIGRIVIFRSRTGDYDVPAIIAGTQDTLNPKNVEATRQIWLMEKRRGGEKKGSGFFDKLRSKKPGDDE